MKDADNKTVLGSVRASEQMSCWETFCETRFNKRAKPMYDILDTDGTIIYTVYVPIRRYKAFSMNKKVLSRELLPAGF